MPNPKLLRAIQLARAIRHRAGFDNGGPAEDYRVLTGPESMSEDEDYTFYSRRDLADAPRSIESGFQPTGAMRMRQTMRNMPRGNEPVTPSLFDDPNFYQLPRPDAPAVAPLPKAQDVGPGRIGTRPSVVRPQARPDTRAYDAARAAAKQAWEGYNQSEDPADFVRASNAMLAMEKAAKAPAAVAKGVVSGSRAAAAPVMSYASLQNMIGGASDRDLMIRTVIGEAAREPAAGKSAVAHVIKNRLNTGKWGDNIKGVLFAPKQFEPWMTRSKSLMSINPESPLYKSVGAIVDGVISGDIADPTKGAINFQNPAIVAQRGNKSGLSWLRRMYDNGTAIRIGNHVFGTAYPSREAGGRVGYATEGAVVASSAPDTMPVPPPRPDDLAIDFPDFEPTEPSGAYEFNPLDEVSSATPNYDNYTVGLDTSYKSMPLLTNLSVNPSDYGSFSGSGDLGGASGLTTFSTDLNDYSNAGANLGYGGNSWDDAIAAAEQRGDFDEAERINQAWGEDQGYGEVDNEIGSPLPEVGRQAMDGGGPAEVMEVPSTAAAEPLLEPPGLPADAVPEFTPPNVSENDAIEFDRRLDREKAQRELVEALAQTWPAQLAKAAYSGGTLAGDVLFGRVDPKSDEGIRRALDLAGLATLGAGAGTRPPGALAAGASRARGAEAALSKGSAKKTAEKPLPKGMKRIIAGTPENDMLKAQEAYKSIVSPFSSDPASVQRALQIASTYRIPQGAEFGTGSFFTIKPPAGVQDVRPNIGPLSGVTPLEPRNLSWEDFAKEAKGGTMINVGGDRMNLGTLRDINDEKRLAWDVPLHAGPKYMLEPNPGMVWANAPGHTTSFNRIIGNAAKEGPVYGVYAPMGPTAVDSSVDMFNAVMSQIPTSKISKVAADNFDKIIRNASFVSKVEDRPRVAELMKLKWPGISNLKTPEQVLALAQSLTGTQRGDLVKAMDKATRRKEGFPDIGATRVAVTDPALLSAPSNTIGHRIVRFDTEGLVSPERKFSHPSYPSESIGTYVGDVPLVQTQYGMPTAMDKLLASRTKKGEVMHPYSVDAMGRSSARKMFTEQKQLQPVNDRLIESIMMGLERQKKYGLRKGGSVSHRALMVGSPNT